MRLSDIAKHLSLEVGPSVINRYLAAERAAPYVRAMLDRGSINWGHLRVLQNLPHEEQVRLASKVLVKKLSMRRLQDEIQREKKPKRLPEPADPNLVDYQNRIQNALQADGLVLSQMTGGRYVLQIEWSALPVLQGILEKLGQAPSCDHKLPTHGRTLTFELESGIELEALVGHLLTEE